MAAWVWRQHGLKPHWIERQVASNDPDFEKWVTEFIGLTLNPLAHAAVFCVDEKIAIQALDRKGAARRTFTGCVALLSDIVIHQLRGKEIHGITDNVPAHKGMLVKEILVAHLQRHAHLTPICSSWLTDVELWFGRIACGVPTSISGLKRKFIR